MPGEKTDYSALDTDMLAYRAIAMGDEITRASVAPLVGKLLQLQIQSPDEPIHLLINSPGGEDVPAMFLHDIIAHFLTVPVHALVIGRCSSAATFVLLACSVRKCTPHARFVIHSGTIGDISLKIKETKHDNLEHLVRVMKRDVEWSLQFYSKKLGLPIKRVRQLIARGDQQFDNELSAQEALEINLVTEIVTGNAGVFPQPLVKEI